MKPAAFEYHAPRNVEEALSLLDEHQDDAKVLAGGQSLVPAMNFRLARPAVLVDIAHLPGLDRIDTSDPDHVSIGARVRHLDLEHNTIAGPLGRLLAQTGPMGGPLSDPGARHLRRKPRPRRPGRRMVRFGVRPRR